MNNINTQLLQKKTKYQKNIAMWQFLLGLIQMIMMVVAIVIMVKTLKDNPNGIVSEEFYDSLINKIMWIIIIILVTGIPSFVLWIIGIINAISINGITQNSVALVVFSIFTFWFIHLIVASVENNKIKFYEKK